MRCSSCHFPRFFALALWVVSCSTPGIKGHDDGGSGQGGSGGPGNNGNGGSGGIFKVIEAGAGGQGATDDDGGTASVRGGGECGLQKYKIDKLPPEMLLVFDRSGSMRMGFGGSTRWKAATEALDASIKDTEDTVSWGLKLYPTTEACDVSADVEVPTVLNNYNGKMSPAIAAAMPNPGVGGTPTQLAVRAATKSLKGLATPNPKYILLATDGEPSCDDGTNSNSAAAIADAFAGGIHTFVVGIATATDQNANNTLNQMAASGGEALDGATKYYTVANKNDLVTKLRQITTKVACVFPLQMAPPSPKDVAVKVGDMRVPPEGWRYGAGMKSIEITGKWCEMLNAADSTATAANVTIIFGCPNVVIE